MLMSSTAIEPRLRIVDDQDGEADRGFGRRHRQDQEGEDLPDDVIEMGRERHQVDVDGEQDELDRHQDDDHVLAVQEDAEDAEREQHGGDDKVMVQPDLHTLPGPLPQMPCRNGTLRISTASSAVRATCREMSCRLTPTRSRKVSTMAPIIATRSTSPAAWKK